LRPTKKKQIFFEKNNQKTFAHCGQPAVQVSHPLADRNGKRFFGSFFKKELLPCLP
jgi:hypothetical protein